MGYKLETTALISKENYNTFRIRCIMLILGKLNINHTLITIAHVFIEIQSRYERSVDNTSDLSIA